MVEHLEKPKSRGNVQQNASFRSHIRVGHQRLQVGRRKLELLLVDFCVRLLSAVFGPCLNRSQVVWAGRNALPPLTEFTSTHHP